MKHIHLHPTHLLVAFIAALAVFYAPDVLASSGESLPWDSPMKTILKSLTGPVAKAIAAIAIVLAGLGLALGEGGGGTRKLLMIVLGIAVAFGAVSLVGSSSAIFNIEDSSSEIDNW